MCRHKRNQFQGVTVNHPLLTKLQWSPIGLTQKLRVLIIIQQHHSVCLELDVYR